MYTIPYYFRSSSVERAGRQRGAVLAFHLRAACGTVVLGGHLHRLRPLLRASLAARLGARRPVRPRVQLAVHRYNNTHTHFSLTVNWVVRQLL